MSTVLENAVGSLLTAIKAAAGVNITYAQGATTKTVVAIPGRTTTEATFADGAVRTAITPDFIVKQSELALVPRQGDTIIWGARKFEVTVGPDNKPADQVGQYNQAYRIHTVEVHAS